MRLRLSDSFTAASLLAGVLSFVFVLEGRWAFAGSMLFASFVFDYLDGFLARKRKSARPFGMYLDSLTDVVVFCALPAAGALAVMGSSPLLLLGALLLLAAGIFRLARYQDTAGKVKGFEGMPITMNGLVIGAIFILEAAFLLPYWFIVSAALMASRIKVGKP